MVSIEKTSIPVCQTFNFISEYLGLTIYDIEARFRRAAARTGCKGLFSEGGDVIKLHIEGSLTIPKPGIKRVYLWEY